MKNFIVTILIFMSFGCFAADEQQTLTNMVALPTNQTVITEEGAFEPDASGSYSIRLYDTDPGNPDTIVYRSGIIRPRTGMLEKVQVTDINGDEEMEIIVLLRSVDETNAQMADIYSFANNELKLLNTVENLAADVDPLEQLRESN